MTPTMPPALSPDFLPPPSSESLGSTGSTQPTGTTRRYEFHLATPPGITPARTSTYPLFVQDGPDWPAFRQRLLDLHADHFTLVADTGLPEALIAQYQTQVRATGVPCLLVRLTASEQHKTIETVLHLLTRARADGGGTHQSCFLALGGGLVGNVTGLAAALLVRGVRLVHLPTTLLAATDSVLSLKQGVNVRDAHQRLVKNLLGTFSSPEWVQVDLSLWQTLPSHEVRAGLCEVVKNVAGIAPELYEEVLHLLRPDATYPLDACHRLFEICFAAKQAVMREDAHEKGPALILELGHTVGHALESLTGLSHGFAVGLGLRVSAQLSLARGWLSAEESARITRLLQQTGAPTTLPADLEVDALLALIGEDNKIGYLPRRPGFHVMVLLQHLGQPAMTEGLPLTYVAEAELRAAIATLQHDAPQPEARAQEGGHDAF